MRTQSSAELDAAVWQDSCVFETRLADAVHVDRIFVVDGHADVGVAAGALSTHEVAVAFVNATVVGSPHGSVSEDGASDAEASDLQPACRIDTLLKQDAVCECGRDTCEEDGKNDDATQGNSPGF
jgi:hypothetical protein